MAPDWFYLKDDARQGPLNTAELLAALFREAEPRMVKIWREGLADWERAGSQPELREQLPPRMPTSVAQSPPPVQGQGLVAEPREALNGIRGWLLLLCIALTIFQPLLGAVTALQFLSSSIVGSGLLAFTSASLATWSFLAGLSLWRRRPGSVRGATVFLLVNFCVNFIVEGVILIQAENPQVISALTGDLGRTAISTFIWARYLATSKRVAATFPRMNTEPAATV